MRNDIVLIALAAICSATCWLPGIREPNLGVPISVPLACVTLSVAVCTSLYSHRSSAVPITCVAATGIGLWGGLTMWPAQDGIAQSYAPLVAIVLTGIVALICLVIRVILWRVPALHPAFRPVACTAAILCAVYGPATLALTPAFVQARIQRDDEMAQLRFAGLKGALRATRQAELCDGPALQQHYSGPPFSSTDWQRITSGYVRQDGYIFMVYCHEKGGYTLDVVSAKPEGYGSRNFCTDESGISGCAVKWDRSRYRCMPCL